MLLRLRENFLQITMAVCAVVYLWQTDGSDEKILDFGVYGPAIVDGEWYRLVTAGFLHTGAMHLLLNMMSFYFLFKVLEPALQHRPWALPGIYVVSLLGGSLGAMVSDFNTTAVGASGAIYGLLGAAVGVPVRRGMSWNAAGVAPWIGVNLLMTFMVPGISIGGHVGGLLTGFVTGWLVGSVRRQPPF